MSSQTLSVVDYSAVGTQLSIAVCTVVLVLLLRTWTSSSPLDNIPGPPPESLWTGNVQQWYSRGGADFQKSVAFNYGPVVRIHGMMGRPMLYVSDPKALQTIIIREENIYQETKIFFTSTRLLFGPGLLATAGEKHRKQRKLLNPVFSINHMRHMIPIFYEVVHRLKDAISARVSDDPKEIDVLHWMGRTALELIGQGGLGYSFDRLTEDVEDEYAQAIKDLQPNLQRLNILRRLLPYVANIGPAWLRSLVMQHYPLQQVRTVKKIVDTMSERSTAIFHAKQDALMKGDEAVVKQVGQGKDIMSILIRANQASNEADRLPEEELIGQMSTLVFAATDTTSNTLARILQVLSEHPDTQQKLREEVLEGKAGEHISYDDLDRLPLLDAVCRETLRLYPPATTSIARTPTKDVVLPLSEPIVGRDGTIMRSIPIPKGTEIIMGIHGSNASTERWGDDSFEWKPERWFEPAPKRVTDAPVPGVYSNLMTFMGGRRACIGFKFSEMEMKVVLAVLLSHFTFEPTEKPITWNVSGVRYPTVGKESNVPQLPLKVGLYKGIGAH